MIHFISDHRQSKSSLIECAKCLKQLLKPIELYNHMVAEHEHGRMLCTKCDFAGSTRFELTCHYAKAHANKYQVVLLKCYLDDCRERFESKEALFDHMKKRHSLAEVICPYSGPCGKSFQNR